MLCTPGEGQVAGSWGEMGPPCLTGSGFGHPVEQVFPPLPKLLGPGGWRELPGLTTRGEGWGGEAVSLPVQEPDTAGVNGWLGRGTHTSPSPSPTGPDAGHWPFPWAAQQECRPPLVLTSQTRLQNAPCMTSSQLQVSKTTLLICSFHKLLCPALLITKNLV